MGNSMMGLREESRMYDPGKSAGFASQEGLSKLQSNYGKQSVQNSRMQNDLCLSKHFKNKIPHL